MKLRDHFDRISLWSGKIIRWLSALLTAVVLFEVASRYLFNKPTIWAYDTAMMVYSALFIGGAAYVTLVRSHIRVDVLFNMLPKRVQMILDLVYYIIFWLPYTFVMILYGSKIAYQSTVAEEISNTSQWLEPVWPWRWLIPAAFVLVLLQCISEIVRTFGEYKELRSTEEAKETGVDKVIVATGVN